VSLELDGWDIVECFVDSLVVEPVDVVECCPFDVFNIAPGSLTVDELGLVEAVETLSECIDAPIAVKPRFVLCFQPVW